MGLPAGKPGGDATGAGRVETDRGVGRRPHETAGIAVQGAHVVVRCNSLVASLNAGIAGMGVAVLPCFLGEAEPGLRRLTDAVLATRAIWVVFHPDVAQIRRVRTVIDFVSTIVTREAPTFRGERAVRAGGA